MILLVGFAVTISVMVAFAIYEKPWKEFEYRDRLFAAWDLYYHGDTEGGRDAFDKLANDSYGKSDYSEIASFLANYCEACIYLNKGQYDKAQDLAVKVVEPGLDDYSLPDEVPV